MSADQLSDKSKLRCPSSMILSGGVCFEANSSPKTPFVTAMKTCLAHGLRLPTEGELILYLTQNSATPPDLHWAEPEYFDGTEFRAAVVGAGATPEIVVGSAPIINELEYLCVTMPSN